MSMSVFVSRGLEDVFIPVVASLPVTFTASGDERGSLHIVDGSDPNWPERIDHAVGAGAIAVVVAEPVPLPGPWGVSTSVPVIVAQEWSSSPVWTEVARASDELARAATIRLRGTLGADARRTLDAALLDSLALMTTLVGSISVTAIGNTSRAVWLEGDARGTRIHIDIVTTLSDGGARLDAYTPRSQLLVELPSGATSAPARMLRIDDLGSRSPPTIYENGNRATLRRAARVINGISTADDLTRLAAVSEQIILASATS